MISNLTKKTVIAWRARHAEGVYERGRGMIGRTFGDFDAMVFDRCDAIHTFFMGASIDVVFVDAGNKVLKIIEDLKPWRMLAHCKNARAVIELPPGAIRKSQTAPGDIVDLKADPTPEALAELKRTGGKFMAEAGAIAPLEETK